MTLSRRIAAYSAPHGPLFHCAAAFAFMLLVVLLYLPGIDGPFVLDDGENITFNRAVAINELNAESLTGALLANNSGPFGRPLASLSFALNAYFAGGVERALPFKVTNILIHGTNSVLVYFFMLCLFQTSRLRDPAPLGRAYLAMAIAMLWAIHPIQLTSVLYVVQRMTSLSSFFVLLGALGFLYGRTRYNDGSARGLWIAGASLVAGSSLGAAVKENAILLPLLALVLEFTLLSRDSMSQRRRQALYLFYGAIAVLPVFLAISYVALNPEFVTSGYVRRDFTLWERVLTQGRVLWFYISLIFLPSTQQLGLFHDDITISTGLLSPPSTIIAMIAWAVCFIGALLGAKRVPWLSFAVLWFLACHALESSVFALEFTYEHRNYLATLGPLLAAVLLFKSAISKYKDDYRIPWVTTALVVTTLSFSTWSRAHTWSDLDALSAAELRNHPFSSRAHDFAARVALQTKGDLVAAINHTVANLKLKPQEVGTHIDLQILLSNLEARLHNDPRVAVAVKNASRRLISIDGLSQSIAIEAGAREIRFSVEGSASDKIDRLLRERPITVHTLFSLDALRRCLLLPPSTCRSLRTETMKWHEFAAANPRSTTEDRAALLHNMALISADSGDYDRALAHLQRASEYEPNEVAYQLGQIEYLWRLGRLDEANRRLQDFSVRTASYQLDANRRNLERLHNGLNRANNQK